MECKWFERHISLDSMGTVRPCCAWRPTGNEPKITNDLDDYYLSNFYKNTYKDLKNDIWPIGCEDCRLEEESGQTSMRQESEHTYRDENYTDAEVKFGNLCNLACAMCGPTNSSLIDTEYKAMRDSGLEHRLIARTAPESNKWYENKYTLERTAEFLSTRKQIRFTGGEPTVNTYLQDFLEALSKYNTNITIQITTNGNNWPSRLNEVLDRFKKKKVSLSIDAVGNQNDYIRYPSKWYKIENTLEKIQGLNNVTTLVGTTVGCYNLHLQSTLADWVLERGIDTHMYNPVWGPEILQPRHATSEYKKCFENLCINYEPARKILPTVMKDGDGMDQAKEYFALLDKHRGTDMRILKI